MCGVKAVVEKKLVADSPLEAALLDLLSHRVAGDPDNASVTYTDLSPRELSARLEHRGMSVSGEPIRQWMSAKKLRLRRIHKVLSCGHSPERDEQFKQIASLIKTYRANGNPYFSIDSKAKEFLGQLYRKGRVRTSEAFCAFDHDFPSLAEGVVIPHGIYDLERNRGHLNLGRSHDTTQFACDSLCWYWNRIGKRCYPDASSILLLCDCGGSNAANKYIFKYDLQRLADRIGIEIRMAHYPSYCSKYNPIERRFFPHVGRACEGMLFDSIETVVDLMRKTSTTTGLKTTVNVISRPYLTGRHATDEIKRNLKIVADDTLPKWNYRAIPQNPTVVS